MCGLCAVGYTFSQAKVTCVPCDNGGSFLSFFNVTVLIFVLLILLLVAHSVYTFRFNKAVSDFDDYHLYLLTKIGVCNLQDFNNNRENLRLDLNNWRSRLEQIIKTYVVLFQVTSAD